MPLALITGGSRGLGAAIAHALGPTHQILLGGRDRVALAALADNLPDAEPWQVELTDPAQVAEAAGRITHLDVLVHSAGVAELGSIEQSPAELWRRTFDVNVFAVAELTRLLLPALRRARGHVVLVNSGAGLRAHPGWGAYAASKHALRAFAESLRAEEPDLRVTSVFPGRIDTDMQRAIVAHEGAEYDETKFLKASTVARSISHAIRTPADAHPTEIVLRPTGRR
jgi:NADP-dependent 3-hydroxy acid dehydrogenase YdfG